MTDCREYFREVILDPFEDENGNDTGTLIVYFAEVCVTIAEDRNEFDLDVTTFDAIETLLDECTEIDLVNVDGLDKTVDEIVAILEDGTAAVGDR